MGIHPTAPCKGIAPVTTSAILDSARICAVANRWAINPLSVAVRVIWAKMAADMARIARAKTTSRRLIPSLDEVLQGIPVRWCLGILKPSLNCRTWSNCRD